MQRNLTAAAELFRRSAEDGLPVAQNNLGFLYSTGLAFARDDAEALRWFRKAAEQGDAWGQTRVGVMFEHGYGVNRDFAQAFRWYLAIAARSIAKLTTRTCEGCPQPMRAM